MKQAQVEYRNILRHSLVYEPSFEESNEAMAALVLKEIILAVANGENRQREILENNENHLQYLSSNKRVVITIYVTEE